jgi:integrase
MNAELRALLLSIQPSPKPLPDALVFTTVSGCIIDSGNFWSLWKKIVTNSGVPYRKPHAIRHTLLSHAVEQGIPLTGVAYLAGHANTRMVIQTYGHMVNRPRLPEMPM